MNKLFFAMLVVVFLTVSNASAAIMHDESVDGDLSDNRLAPTALVLVQGTNTLLASTGGGNRDYLTISVPAGKQLSSITLVSYAGTDDTAFMAVQNGGVITEDPAAPNVNNLLGWTHYGPGVGNVGTDILDDLGNGAGAIGFTPPLAAGDYSIWLQQLGASVVSYQMDFEVVPEPACIGMILLGAAVMRRRRR